MTSQEETSPYVDALENAALRERYREIMRNTVDRPDVWKWYAIWAIELKDGTVVGGVAFKGLNADGMVEIGYGVFDGHEGRGYATEAVGALTSWALRQPGVLRVEAETAPDNLASQRVLEKCGFVPLGKNGDVGPRFVWKGR